MKDISIKEKLINAISEISDEIGNVELNKNPYERDVQLLRLARSLRDHKVREYLVSFIMCKIEG